MFIFMHHAEMVTKSMRKELINGIFEERSPKISDNALPTKTSAFFKDKFSYFQYFIPTKENTYNAVQKLWGQATSS